MFWKVNPSVVVVGRLLFERSQQRMEIDPKPKAKTLSQSEPKTVAHIGDRDCVGVRLALHYFPNKKITGGSQARSLYATPPPAHEF